MQGRVLLNSAEVHERNSCDKKGSVYLRHRMPLRLLLLLLLVILLTTAGGLGWAGAQTVSPRAAADLVITIAGPQRVAPGEQFSDRITLTVTNTGTAPAQGTADGSAGYTIDLLLSEDRQIPLIRRDGDHDLPLISITDTPSLQPGESATLHATRLTLPADTPDGAYCIGAAIQTGSDPDLDRDPTNSTACLEVQVAGTQAVLSRVVDFTPPPGPPRPDSELPEATAGQVLSYFPVIQDALTKITEPGQLPEGYRLIGVLDIRPSRGLTVYARLPGLERFEAPFYAELILSTQDSVPIKPAMTSDRFVDGVRLARFPFGPAISRLVPIRPIPVDTPPGRYCLALVIDPTNRIPEMNEFNNAGCQWIEVVAPPPGDLAVSLQSTGEIIAGQEITSKIQTSFYRWPKAKDGTIITNQQMLSSYTVWLTTPKAFAARTTAGPEGGLLLWSQPEATVGPLPDTITRKIPVDTPPGEYCLAAIMRPSPGMQDSDSSNDAICQPLRVWAAPPPGSADLRLESVLAPRTVHPADSISLTIDVANGGAAAPAAVAYQVHLMIARAIDMDRLADPANVVTSISRVGIIPGQERLSHELSVTVPPDLAPGEYKLAAVVYSLSDQERELADNLAWASLTVEPEPVPSPFSDLPSTDGAFEPVTLLMAHGVIDGFPDGTFRPGAPVTRAELAKMLVLVAFAGAMDAAPPGGGPVHAAPGPVFADTTGHWADSSGYLAAAVRFGLFRGFPDGTFRPDAPVTRAQAVQALTGLVSGVRPLPEPEGMPADIPQGAWFRRAVAMGLKAGLMGRGASYPVFADESFEGERLITRAEVARLLANALGRP